MEFTPRIRKILLILLEQEKPISEQEIAAQIGVSKRTVLREFEYLADSLKPYALALKKKKGQGTWLEGSVSQKEELKNLLSDSKTKDLSDKDKRRKYLILELLRSKEPRKIFTYANKFGVSEATISGDLKAIEEWFLKSHLKIVKKTGYGVVLRGSEKNHRHALQRFFNENLDNKEIYRLFGKEELILPEILDNQGEVSTIYEVLNSDKIARITHTLLQMNEPRLKAITENSFAGLVMHLSIALERIMNGEVIENNFSNQDTFDEDYDLAVKILKNLEKEFSIVIPEIETGYIMLHIKGAKLQYSNQKEDPHHLVGAEQILELVDEMIDEFDLEKACELKADEEFIHGLLVHLEPTVVRLKNEMNIYNPLLEEIKQEYRDTFNRCTKAAKVITKKTGFKVSEEEVGYLVMHFGAALERLSNQKTKERPVEIGVICASGFGVARLMLVKLQNQLKKQVSLSAYGRDELTPYITAKIDFFVSSIALDLIGIDYVLVSPLIPPNDLQKVQIKVDEYARMPVKVEKNDFTRQLDEINFLSAKIKTILRMYRDIRISKDSDFEQMLTLIGKEITIKVMAREILKEDLLAREQLMSQIFPELKIALLHCRTRAVGEVAFYTCRPREGGKFTHPYLKKIQTAIILLMPVDTNREQNSQILGQISSALVDNDGFMEAVLTGTEEKIREELQKILKLYFNTYISKI